MKHIMIDLETLGTTADAVIMSIGAVKFDLESEKMNDKAFYASVSIDSNLDAGRRVDEGTLIWWLKQEAAAQNVFFEPKQTLENALDELIDFFDRDDYTVWSNGADFDIPMLAHAMKHFGMTTPWQFWNSRCVRTYKSLPAARDVPKQVSGIKHNAMSDAINQAKLVQAIHRAMKETA